MSRQLKVSPNQSLMFQIDDSENVTYLINGFPQTLEEVQKYNPEFFDVDLDDLTLQMDLVGYSDEIETKKSIEEIEKEDDKTILLTISDLERVKKILTAIPQFRDLASNTNQDVNSIEFLAYAVKQIDFMSLPSFNIDMSIFEMLPKDNPEYRDSIFTSILDIIDLIGEYNKFPRRKYLESFFVEFSSEQIDKIYLLLKRFITLFNTWGGIQVHLFEQAIRDWMYVAFEMSCAMTKEQILEYLAVKYPCKPDFEVKYLAEIIFNSVSQNAQLDTFTNEFISFLYCFYPQANQFLTQEEISRLWTSDFIKNRIVRASEKWRSRLTLSNVATPENELDAYFGVSNRLSTRVNQQQLPEEVYGDKSINEVLVKMQIYFNGFRTLVEARFDRLTQTGLYDWKTTKKEYKDLNDFEKLQILLQCIAAQQLHSKFPNLDGLPTADKDYKFFFTSFRFEWIDLNSLPDFFHIPENTTEIYDYVLLNIPIEEAQRLLNNFAEIIEFLICNKKVFNKLKRYLKNMDALIPSPVLVEPAVLLDENLLEG